MECVECFCLLLPSRISNPKQVFTKTWMAFSSRFDIAETRTQLDAERFPGQTQNNKDTSCVLQRWTTRTTVMTTSKNANTDTRSNNKLLRAQEDPT